jgi:cyclopropane fatty-acyl-phospholipid synthase-like methyltransferase
VDPADVVRAGYDAIGPRYHEWSHATPTRVAYVEHLLDRLTPGSRVLELGCGPGDPATRLLAERHTVVGVELSRVQLDLAKANAPGARLVQADLTTLSGRPGSVDAVAAFYAFGHLPAAAHAPLLTAIGGWLRPGGVLLANAPLSAGDGTEEWLGVEMFFGGIGRQPTIAALVAGGLTIESAEEVQEDRKERFLWVVAVRPGSTPRPTRSGEAPG